MPNDGLHHSCRSGSDDLPQRPMGNALPNTCLVAETCKLPCSHSVLVSALPNLIDILAAWLGA